MKENRCLLFCLIFFAVSCQTIPAICFSDSTKGVDILLEKPSATVNTDLMEAYALRKSTKYFSRKEISLAELSTILWSANGINRKDGKRTAPSPFAKELIKVYVFSINGIYWYDAKQHCLKFLSSENCKIDIGAKSGARGVETAPLVLMLTGDISQFPDFITRDVRINSAHATAGAVGQNIYLIANALNLGTRFVGSINPEGIRRCVQLGVDEIPLYIMPLGHKQ